MAKKDYITLHSEYGLNPTLPVCIFCGKERGEIALLGAAYRRRAPKHMVIDHVPCAECKAKMALGTTILVVDDKDTSPSPRLGYFATSEGTHVKFTGEWHVVKSEVVEEKFGIAAPMLLTTVEDARHMGLLAEPPKDSTKGE